jgi:colanic acid/amylovoran biosynthesis glycosyltransferase
MDSRSLIITGMHRSGTSLAAQIFYRAGLFMGDNLMKPSPNNPDGYFEDKDIIAFHDDIFHFNGIERWRSPSTITGQISLPPGSQEKAGGLIERKFDGQKLWGWKDPRTSWFLPFWKSILPEAKFVFTYRKPAEVAWSLIRRGDYKEYSDSLTQRVMFAVKHWVKTYQEILSFLSGNQDDGVLLFVPEDLQNQEQKAIFVKVIGDLWGLNLSDLANQTTQTYKPRLLKNKIPGSINLISKLYLPARETNNQLIRVHHQMTSNYAVRLGSIRNAEIVGEGIAKSKSVVSIISPSVNLYSETFIQAHIDRLPANVKPLYGYPFPNLTGNGDELYVSSSMKNRVLRIAGGRFFNLNSRSLHKAAVKDFLLNQRVDVVLAEYGHTGVSIMDVCRETNIPLVVHFHGHDVYRKTILTSEGQNYPELFELSAALIVVSKDMRRQLVKLGAPEGKIILNPYGVDVDQFRGGDPSKAPPMFVAVGRFVDKKAPHLTLLAFSKLFESYPDARLVMIGDGPLLEACQQLAGALCISGAVEFRGARSHAEVAETMRRSRAFVQHSIQTSYGDSEGTPVAVMEASASGLPIAATKHAGIQDVVIEEETGFLVPEGDISGMAESMKMLAEDPDLATRLGKKGRERVINHFSMDKSIDNLWAVLSKVIESKA